MRITDTVRRRHVVLAAVAGGIAAAALATPGWAHVEVEADKAQAGAQDVTLTFKGEAESGSAGISSERVVLPAGISSADVRLKKAAKGWKLTPGSDGFTVAGPALKVGEDAEFAVVVAQLPANATTLAFKTIETYSDGKVSRWIELPEDGQPEPDNPAPMLKVKAAAAPATSSPAPATSSPAAPVSAPAVIPSSATTDVVAEADESSSSNNGLWITIGVIAVAAIAAVAFLVARRRGNANRGA